MTQFRYNVLLSTQPVAADHHLPHPDWPHSTVAGMPPDRTEHHDWKLNPVTPQAIKQHLSQTNPDLFILTNIANSRVQAAIQVEAWLRQPRSPKTVGRMREVLQDSGELAIAPQDWWELADSLPYAVEVTCSPHNQPGDYEVVFLRQGLASRGIAVQRPYPTLTSPYANEPLQATFARQLIPQLRQYLKQTLPDYMVPSTFIPLDTLPLTSSGKLNRGALPTLEPEERYLCNTASDSLTPTESTLVEIWKELLRLKQVSIQDNFFELGGHSLLATQMTSRIRDAFGLEVPLKHVFAAPTIAQLAPILETLQGSATQIPPLVRLDRSAYRRKRSTLSHKKVEVSRDQGATVDSITDARSPLIPLTVGGHQPPFFCVHPMFGVVFPYLELAHHLAAYLGEQRSFYGLQPAGLDGKSAPLNRIEAIAAYYIQAIQAVQPQGPYFLGGWSFGGLVAFEMAQQLTQAGQEVSLLAILDTPAPSHKPSFSQTVQFLLGTALWSTLPFLRDYGLLAADRLPIWQSWLSRWQWSVIARLIPEASRLRLLDESAIVPMLRIVHAHAQAAYHYQPRPYLHPMALFKAMEQSEAIGQDATLAWSALVNKIEVYAVPGNHLSLLKHPHVQTLAQQLGQCLCR